MKLWGGRFKEPLNPLIEEFLSSLPVDRRLILYDILSTKAHAKALRKAGIIGEELEGKILSALEKLEEEIKKGKIEIKGDEAEDVHTLLENWLYEQVGEEAGFLRYARSRNDQIACDMRLFLKEEIKSIIEAIHALQAILLSLAEAHKDYILPGYTHLQRAQPVLLSHHLLAYFWMLQRDKERLKDAYKRVDVSPQGAGALAGVELDPQVIAQELGFGKVFENSLDAVSDRDFILEFLADACISSLHLSRLANEIVLWSTQEFAFVQLADAVCTGSSIMPHKKNPDPAELIRAKAGRMLGNFVSLFTILKGLPLAYNIDLQEDKGFLFDAVDTLKSSLYAMGKILENLSFNRERMEESVDDYLLAVDVADYLLKKGTPFRKAHRIVGQVISYALEQGKKLKELDLEEWKRFSPLFEDDIYGCLSLESYLTRRNFPGGTGEGAVTAQIKKAQEVLAKDGGII